MDERSGFHAFLGGEGQSHHPPRQDLHDGTEEIANLRDSQGRERALLGNHLGVAPQCPHLLRETGPLP